MGTTSEHSAISRTRHLAVASSRLLPVLRRVVPLRLLLVLIGTPLGLAMGRPATARAQAVAGLGDDAIPLPKGGKQFLVSGLWNDWDGAYVATGTGGARKQALFAALSTTQAGAVNHCGEDQLPLSTQATTRGQTIGPRSGVRMGGCGGAWRGAVAGQGH